jgi:hypothetical protein
MRRVWTNLMLGLVVILGATSCSSSSQRPQTIYKLVMPGTYSIHCEQGPYSGWYFWQWKSKDVDAQQTPIAVSINDENKKPVSIGTKISDYTEVGRGGRLGRQEFVFDAPHSGSYEITCTYRCVLVIVPKNELIANSNSTVCFPGSDNDADFLPSH